MERCNPEVLDVDENATLKLIQNIRYNRLVNGRIWLDQPCAVVNT
jgi:hypothetical protein